jgi:hypothetical protein
VLGPAWIRTFSPKKNTIEVQKTQKKTRYLCMYVDQKFPKKKKRQLINQGKPPSLSPKVPCALRLVVLLGEWIA